MRAKKCKECLRHNADDYAEESPTVCHRWHREQDYYFSGDENCAEEAERVRVYTWLLAHDFLDAAVAMRLEYWPK